MVEWVFFDVGNVLFNDDAQAFTAYRIAYSAIQRRHPDYSFEDMLAEREELARAGESWIMRRIVTRRMPDEELEPLFREIARELDRLYDENHLLNPGVPEVLVELRQEFRLGIIANQTPECRGSLERRELLKLFDVVAISDELGVSKPNPAIFQWAMRESAVAPERSVMVGDRMDNDVIPASELGMRSVWLQWGPSEHRPWKPDEVMGRQFLSSCDREPLFGRMSQAGTAYHTAADLFEAVHAIRTVAGRK
jgi:HAD superfamily hydrolase (TIGR01549 family)